MPAKKSREKRTIPGADDMTECHEDEDQNSIEPIAIIGFSLKFPQDATSPEAFWKMMAEKRCAMTEFPPDRLNVNAFYHPDSTKRNAFSVRGGHFIKEDLGAFDAKFFSITPAEAAAMDPAQRILLETAFRALENSGIPLNGLSGSNTAVYTGCFSNDYLLQLLKDPEYLPTYAATGASLAMLANRLSWFFDLSGPSVNLDSACSSSAMAVDQACQVLHSKQSNMALVAGCNLTYFPEYTKILTNMNFLSPDDRCFAFDHRANGYSRGEGVGVLVLKRLSQALQDQDTIRAVIRSTGCNQDGRTAGITQPNSQAQERLMKETYLRAGLSMAKTRFFEAHGTGTAIGDPTEISAISGAFGKFRSRREPLFVGAVKTNVGHLEGASGIAGIIKTILILETGIILPNTNFEEPNRKIDIEGACIALPQECIPWPSHGLRRASINSFGFGGANCHLVLDDAFHYLSQRGFVGNVRTAPHAAKTINSFRTPHLQLRSRPGLSDDVNPFRTPKLLVWSASDEVSLKQMVLRYQEHCLTLPDPILGKVQYIGNLAYTLDSRRSSLQWKSYAVVGSVDDMKSFAKAASRPTATKIRSPSLAFVFTGQGAQWHAMGRELFIYPVFEKSIEHSMAILATLGCSWSIRDELHKDKHESNVDRPEFSQALCAALQMGLVDLLRSLGVIPGAVVGHSSGEIAAAYCAGALSRESALKIAYYRGLLAASIPGKSSTNGAMLAVNLSVKRIGPYFDKIRETFTELDLVVGCVNSPTNITVSGAESQINTLKQLLEIDGIFARKLQVNVAYHSPQMNGIACTYLSILGTFQVHDPLCNIQMISSVTGSRVSKEELCKASYWVENMVSTVQFLDAVQFLCSKSRHSVKRKKLDRSHRLEIVVDELIEIGPHAALQRPIKDIVQASGRKEISYNSTLYRSISASKTMLGLVGHLYCIGVPVNLRRVNDAESCGTASRVALADLPEYPFNHLERYWHESRISSNSRLRSHGATDLLGSPALDWNPLDPTWRCCVRIADIPWIEDHKVNGKILYPAAAMVVMALEAAQQIADQQRCVTGYTLRHVKFENPLEILPSSTDTETRLCLRALGSTGKSGISSYRFVLFALLSGNWIENCNGLIEIHYANPDDCKETADKLAHYQELSQFFAKRCSNDVDIKVMYRFLREHGLNYGTFFQGMKTARYGTNKEAAATIEVSKGLQVHSPSEVRVIHPTILDSVIQLTLLALTNGGTREMSTQVVTGIEKMWISNVTPVSRDDTLDVFTKISMETARNTKSSFFALSQKGENLRLVIEGLEISALGNSLVDVERSPGAGQLWCGINTMVNIDTLTPNDTLDWLERTCGPDPRGPLSFHLDMKEYLISVLRNLRYERQSNGIVIKSSHLNKYMDWVNWQLENHDAFEGDTSCRASTDALVSRIKKQGSVGRFFLKIAENVLGILRGDVDVLQVLFEDNLVKDYYAEQSFGSKCFVKLEKYLDALAHKRSHMQILEVGAGTGTFTDCILRALSFHDGVKCPAPRYDQYVFSDISPSFFEKAKTTFSDHEHKMTFKVLDIERDSAAQGYKEGSFDIITASNVLHVTKNLAGTICAMRKLLKPGGKLIFHEIVCPTDIKTGFAFGLLPGWWLGTEENRAMGPTVTEDTWHKILSENGFSGIDFSLRDYADDACHQMSIIVSTATESLESIKAPDVAIVVEPESSLQLSIANTLQQRMLKEQYSTVRVVSLADAAISGTCAGLLIMLVDIETPILQRLDEDNWAELRIVLSEGQILWVTNGDATKNPGFGMIDGFARVLRIERNKLDLVTLALEGIGVVDKDHARNILRVATELQNNSSDLDLEHLEVDGMLNVGRISEHTSLKSAMLEKLSSKKTVSQSVGLTQSLTVKILIPGQLDTLQITEDTKRYGMLQADEIEVQIQAVGLNSLDSFAVLGRSSCSDLGNECAGVVRAIGSNSLFVPGDRVCMFGSNVLGSLARTKQKLVARIPDNVSFCTASVLPQDYLIASYLLHRAAGLVKNETILIHGGHNSMTKAVMNLSLDAGSYLWITVASKEDEYFLRGSYKSGRVTFLSHSHFSEQLHRATSGNGVDVVIDLSLTGNQSALMDCISPYGRFVQVESLQKTSLPEISLSQIPANITYKRVNTLSILQDRRDLIETPLQALIDTATRYHEPSNERLRLFKLSQLEEAFTALRETGSQDRVAIEIDKEDRVSIVQDVEPTYSLDPCSSYLIAGGLGDLGRCVAKWMVQRGAKSLILLSRNGCRTEAARSMVAEMKEMGILISIPSCDITDKTALEKTINECSRTAPPIKGCVQTSAVLKDIMYEKMSFEEWNAAVRPKVNGSWNLHELLPKGMDFFIMASSISGVLGQVTQINYAAGNTFQDALARFRIANGEKAVSLDLGILMTGGLLEQNHDLMDRLVRTGCYTPISEAEILAMFDYFCDPAREIQSVSEAQVIVGIKSPVEVEAHGNEVLDVMRQPLWSQMFLSSGTRTISTKAVEEPGSLSTLLEKAESTEQASTVVTGALTQRFSRMLAMSEDTLNVEEPLHVNGADSLSAVDLRNWIAKTFGVDIPVFDLLGDSSINTIGALIARKWKAVQSGQGLSEH